MRVCINTPVVKNLINYFSQNQDVAPFFFDIYGFCVYLEDIECLDIKIDLCHECGKFAWEHIGILINAFERFNQIDLDLESYTDELKSCKPCSINLCDYITIDVSYCHQSCCKKCCEPKRSCCPPKKEIYDPCCADKHSYYCENKKQDKCPKNYCDPCCMKGYKRVKTKSWDCKCEDCGCTRPKMKSVKKDPYLKKYYQDCCPSPKKQPCCCDNYDYKNSEKYKELLTLIRHIAGKDCKKKCSETCCPCSSCKKKEDPCKCPTKCTYTPHIPLDTIHGVFDRDC